MMHKFSAFLFDLDGTLLDTAPDLFAALNQLSQAYGKKNQLTLAAFRHIANAGAKSMIQAAFSISDHDAVFPKLREDFLNFYLQQPAAATVFFPHINEFLLHLEDKKIPWAIVTNKLTLPTQAILNALQITHRPACVVCGDTLTQSKPSPEPLLYACKQMQVDPAHCLFIGDTKTDIDAGKAAQMQTAAVLYGYISPDENPYQWGADNYLQDAKALYEFVP